MYSHTPGDSGPRAWNSSAVKSDSQQFTEVYFSYSSNMSPNTMKGRHPGSLFCGLARLDGWKWNINSTQFANIVRGSEDDKVYGGLYFISAMDEAAIDDMEGVPSHYQKQRLEVTRINADGSSADQTVKALIYIDENRPDEGRIAIEYVVWIRKALRDAQPYGLPKDYVDYISSFLPANEDAEVEKDMEPIRIMFSKDKFK